MAEHIRSRHFESVCNSRVRLDFYIQGRREGIHLNRADLLKSQLLFHNQFGIRIFVRCTIIRFLRFKLIFLRPRARNNYANAAF